MPPAARRRQSGQVSESLVVRHALQSLAVDALRRPPERPVRADDLRAEEDRRDDPVRLEDVRQARVPSVAVVEREGQCARRNFAPVLWSAAPRRAGRRRRMRADAPTRPAATRAPGESGRGSGARRRRCARPRAGRGTAPRPRALRPKPRGGPPSGRPARAAIPAPPRRRPRATTSSQAGMTVSHA